MGIHSLLEGTPVQAVPGNPVETQSEAVRVYWNVAVGLAATAGLPKGVSICSGVLVDGLGVADGNGGFVHTGERGVWVLVAGISVSTFAEQAFKIIPTEIAVRKNKFESAWANSFSRLFSTIN